MGELFILQNQDGLFLSKQGHWIDGRDAGGVFKTLFKDEAVNQLFEASSKDYTQRIKVVSCRTNEKGLPVVDATLTPASSVNAASSLQARNDSESSCDTDTPQAATPST